MDENGTFFYNVWRLVALSIVALTATIASCNSYQNHKITEMVKNGANPQDANCAIIGVNQSNAAVCAVRALK